MKKAEKSQAGIIDQHEYQQAKSQSLESGNSWRNEFEIIRDAIASGNKNAEEIARSVFEIVYQRGAIDASLRIMGGR